MRKIIMFACVALLFLGISSMEAQSITFDVEDLEGLTRWHPKPGPFMFYHIIMGQHLPFFAWTGIDWNSERTKSTLIETDSLDDLIDDEDEVSILMSGFDLHSFSHINVINPGEPIQDGEIGDFRIYTGGHGNIKVNQQEVIRFKNLQVEVLVHYPEHVLPVSGPGDYTEAYGFGDIDKENSDPEWVEKFDQSSGQVDFVFESFTGHIEEPAFYDGTVRIEGKGHKTKVVTHLFEEDENTVDFLDEIGLKFNFEYINPSIYKDNDEKLEAVKTMVAYQIFQDGEDNLPPGIPSFNSKYYYRIDAVTGDFKCNIKFDLSEVSGLPDDLNKIVILRRPVTGSSDSGWQKITKDLEVISHIPPQVRISGIESFGEIAVGSLQEGTLPVNFDAKVSQATKLKGSFPNPFNMNTNIRFYLDEATKVTITIYNTKGQVTKRLVDRKMYSGNNYYVERWDGKDEHGNEVSSGVYLYLMQTRDGYRESKKMLLLK